jgi:ABC-type transport system substrate-binding protein
MNGRIGTTRWRWGLVAGLALAAALASARTAFPAGPGPAEGAAAVVRGNPDAPVGGVRRNHTSVSPAQLHPLNATDLYANQVLERVYESLAETDVETLEHVPLLARSWEIGADKLTYTFHLHPDARWQDGRPVTAEDVAFSFRVLNDPRLKTRVKWQSYYSNVASAEAVNARTVRFTMHRDHFRNFVNVAGLRIVPKHGFPDPDPNETPLAREPSGSGPYRFVRWKKGNSVLLRKDPAYWAQGLPQNRGRYNQELLLTKIIAQDKVALEAFKKGDLDVILFTPEQWVREAVGPDFGLGAGSGKPLIKLDVQNRAPRSYRYVGWNLGAPLFSDVRVRRALSHLFDRDTFIDKFYHGLQAKAVGPFEANSPYRSPNVQPIEFSIPKAIALLREAGWRDGDGDQVLERDGRPFRFTVMTADPETSVKILTLTKESMRKAGVDLQIKVVDWATLLALIDEYRFDAVMLGWTRSPWPDPTALWHSASAGKGGLNLVRYRNPEVDQLIEQAVRTLPEPERVKLFRRIHERIHADQPYTFLTENSHTLVGYRAGFRQAQPWYAFDVGFDYWWIDQATR